jgi:hypothetical protein
MSSQNIAELGPFEYIEPGDRTRTHYYKLTVVIKISALFSELFLSIKSFRRVDISTSKSTVYKFPFFLSRWSKNQIG